MSVDLQPLKELFEYIDGALPWGEVKPCLKFWVDVANDETSLLKPESGLDAEAYRVAVEAAMGREVTEVVFVSSICPRWMRGEVYAANLRESLGETLRYSIMVSLRYSRMASFGDSFMASLRDCIWESLGVSLGASLRASLGESFLDSSGLNLTDRFRNNLEDSLRYSLAFALAGNRERFEQFKALLAAQEGAIGFGFLKDEPTVFLALVA